MWTFLQNSPIVPWPIALILISWLNIHFEADCSGTSRSLNFAQFLMDLFHNVDQIKYSPVFMSISLSSLSTTSKFEKNICFQMRAVNLINKNTKERKGEKLYGVLRYSQEKSVCS